MIELKHVSFSYENGTPSLKDIDLLISSGEVICFTGASGCGKTTLLRLFNGLIPYFFNGKLTGEIIINGTSTQTQSIYDLSQQTGSVFQNPRAQFFCLNSTSEMAFEAENYGYHPQYITEQIRKGTTDLNLSHLLDRDIFKLSGGEKQLLACATIEVCQHDIIILDEPSSNLDHETIKKLKQLILRWKQAGKTVIIAEHRLYYLYDIVDRLVVMEQGAVAHSYTSAELKQLTQTQLAGLGLRATRLDLLPGKSHQRHIDSENRLQLNEFNFKYKKQDKTTLQLGDLSLARGSVTAIVGHNGAGKSTFARCLCGLERHFKGTVVEAQLTLKRKARLKNVFMVFQDVHRQLFAEDLEEELRLSDETLTAEEIQHNLEIFNIAHQSDTHPLALSGGQQQRLAVASAVVSNRKILIFDEPSSGLDGANMRQMAALLNRLADKGYTIVLITHDYELLMACTDEVIEIEHGQLVAQFVLNPENEMRLAPLFIN